LRCHKRSKEKTRELMRKKGGKSKKLEQGVVTVVKKKGRGEKTGEWAEAFFMRKREKNHELKGTGRTATRKKQGATKKAAFPINRVCRPKAAND